MLALSASVRVALHRSLRTRTAIAVTVGACLTAACRRGPAVAPRINQPELHAAVESVVSDKGVPSFVVRGAGGHRLWSTTREFYQKRQFAPAWWGDQSGQPRIEQLLDSLQHADRDALNPARYRLEDVERLRGALAHGPNTDARVHEVAALDVRLTYLYLQYATDVTTGVTETRARWRVPADTFDAAASLEDALARDSVADTLARLQQRDPEYAALRSALQRYRDIAARGGWPALPRTLRLKPGEHSPAVAILARRLAVTGDYPANDAQPASYDEDLQDAVKRFQRRHGLTPDGVVGREVVEQLNVPAESRVQQIAVNMERLRWLPRDRGRHLFVNIPEYRLEVLDNGQAPLSMRVVVGRKDAQTPAFSSEMSYIVLAPFWNVPSDIAEKETLPSLEKDPAFLRRTNMEVVDKRGKPVDPEEIDATDLRAYRFRQRPGSSNSLGLVKFMFPNPYNVYLHDTPADSLFARETRAFSHGCVRLEEPEKLAEYVLADQPDWTSDRIREAMHGAEQTTVRLRRKLPVYIGYLTARVAPDGQVMFFKDVYGRDGGRS